MQKLMHRQPKWLPCFFIQMIEIRQLNEESRLTLKSCVRNMTFVESVCSAAW